MLIGLPIDGSPETRHGWSTDRDALYDCLFELVLLVSAYKSECIKLIWLDIHFKTPIIYNRGAFGYGW